MLKLAYQLKNTTRIPFFVGIKKTINFSNPNSSYANSFFKKSNLVCLINSSLSKQSFSSQKPEPNSEKSSGRKFYRNQKQSSDPSFPVQLLSQIEKLIHSNPKKRMKLERCSDLIFFIDSDEMYRQIRTLRNYILQIKYPEIKKLNTKALFDLLENIKENYDLTENTQGLLSNIDWENSHLHVAVLAYFAQLFLMVPLLQHISAGENVVYKEKLISVYQNLAFCLSDKYNIISFLKRDARFIKPEERFRFAVKSQIFKQFFDFHQQFDSFRLIKKRQINLEASMIQEALMKVLNCYKNSQNFQKVAVEQLEKILSRKSDKKLSAQETEMYNNGQRSIEYLKGLIEMLKIKRVEKTSQIKKNIEINPFVSIASEFAMFGNGPYIKFMGESFDDVNPDNHFDPSNFHGFDGFNGFDGFDGF